MKYTAFRKSDASSDVRIISIWSVAFPAFLKFSYCTSHKIYIFFTLHLLNLLTSRSEVRFPEEVGAAKGAEEPMSPTFDVS